MVKSLSHEEPRANGRKGKSHGNVIWSGLDLLGNKIEKSLTKESMGTKRLQNKWKHFKWKNVWCHDTTKSKYIYIIEY